MILTETVTGLKAVDIHGKTMYDPVKIEETIEKYKPKQLGKYKVLRLKDRWYTVKGTKIVHFNVKDLNELKENDTLPPL